MVETKRVYLFPPVLEKLYFAVLAVFLVLMAVYGFSFSLARGEKQILELATFLFLLSTHTIITLLLIIFTPEFRGLIKEKGKSIFWRVKVGGISALILGGSIFLAYEISLDESLSLLVILFMGVLFSSHAAAQVRGLSLIYNRRHFSCLDAGETARFLRVEAVERWLFIPVICGLPAAFFCG